VSQEIGLAEDLTYLYSPKSKYSAEQKLSVVAIYALTGNLEQCHKQTGINYATIKDWHTRSTWWEEAMLNVRKHMQDELDGKLTGVINRATDEIVDRLDNGDEVLDKNGNTRRKKLSARDLTMVLAILFDKRALIRGDPTTRTEKVSSEETLNKMLSKFEDLAKKMNANVINAQPQYKIDNDIGD
jgi:hypothetical protein